MNASGPSPHNPIHEGGYGSPMPEEEMPVPAAATEDDEDSATDAGEAETGGDGNS